MKFLKTLFDDADHICLSPDARGTSVHPWQRAADLPWVRLFSINPLHPQRDLDPRREFHAVQRPRRADANVVAFRNFLIEIDTLDLPDQLDLVDKSGLPYATCTYSGGKSYHLIVSLNTPCADETQYRSLAKRIYEAVDQTAGKPVVDKNNKNPSRLSRFPGVVRKDTGSEQRLLGVRGRIDVGTLEQWLTDHGVTKEKSCAPRALRRIKVTENRKAAPRPATEFFLKFGAATGQRHTRLFQASCDLAECGYSFDEMIVELENARQKIVASDFPQREFEQTVLAAFERVSCKQVG